MNRRARATPSRNSRARNAAIAVDDAGGWIREIGPRIPVSSDRHFRPRALGRIWDVVRTISHLSAALRHVRYSIFNIPNVHTSPRFPPRSAARRSSPLSKIDILISDATNIIGPYGYSLIMLIQKCGDGILDTGMWNRRYAKYYRNYI